MSQLKQLSILGFRAFDNRQNEALEFFTPLTLIVGTNGSGKTTIIECLKYATMGDMPPNTKGGAFIHDPKMCGEKEVMAQVKLLFYSTDRTRVVVTRSAQLTAQKTGRTQMKTLDGNLLMHMPSRERTSLSRKQAELDSIIPKFLGAGPAILDNVIFCHQDESLWPLSEPSTLKKKFDEIFEAQKYTKAIDNIKVLRKKKNEELNGFRIAESQAKVDKERAKKLEQQRDSLAAEIEQMKDKQRELYVEIQGLEKDREDATLNFDKFRNIVTDAERLQTIANEKRQTVSFLKSQIGAGMSESDAELGDHLSAFEERALSRQQQLSSHNSEYQELSKMVEANRGELNRHKEELGDAKAQQRSYERHLEERAATVKEIARSHNMRGFDHGLDEQTIQEFSTKLDRLSKEQTSLLNRTRQEFAQQLSNVQGEIATQNAELSTLDQSKREASRRIADNDSVIERKRAELFDMDVDEGRQMIMESNVADVKAKLARIKQDYEAADWDGKMHDANSRVKKLEEKATMLNEELINASALSNESARIEVMKETRFKEQQALDTMVGAHGDRLTALLGSSWSASTLDDMYQKVLSEKAQILRDAERQRDGTILEVESVRRRLESTRRDLEARRDARNKSHDMIMAVFKNILEEDAPSDPSEFEDELDRLEKNRIILKSDMDSMSASAEYFKQCLATLRSAHVCRLCERSFASNKDFEKLEMKLRKFVSPDALKAVQADHESTEAQLHELRSLQPTYEDWKRSKSDIQALQQTESSSSSDYNNAIQQSEGCESVVAESLRARREVESFSKTIGTIAKHHSDILNLDKQIRGIEAKRVDSISIRAQSEINEEYKLVNKQARDASSDASRLAVDRERQKGLLNTVELQLRDTTSDLDKVLQQLRDKTSLESQIREMSDASESQAGKIQTATRSIEDIQTKIAQSRAKHEDLSQRAEIREQELQAHSGRLIDSIGRLKVADRAINAFLEAGGQEQVARAEQKIDLLKAKDLNLQADQNNIAKTIKKLEDQIGNERENKRQIQDNLSYRRDVSALREVESKICELDNLNAQSDQKYWQDEKDRLGAEINVRVASQQSILGEMKSKDKFLADRIEEYDDQYADAADKYKELHITVEVTKAAIQDLGRYGQALDNAIMTYHTLKMEEINRIIEELWRQTYRGTDIDTILIRSDSDKDTTSKTSKSYNYRVCMIKQDVEMDMRGRCSAGQKVLASIIIRLALAECFGLACGVIALDEPTTNLDRDNIVSLAESIHRIIGARKSQKNFQLIVITHDEDFLKAMRCSDFVDHYYRVQRNHSQKSEIIMQSIHALE